MQIADLWSELHDPQLDGTVVGYHEYAESSLQLGDRAERNHHRIFAPVDDRTHPGELPGQYDTARIVEIRFHRERTSGRVYCSVIGDDMACVLVQRAVGEDQLQVATLLGRGVAARLLAKVCDFSGETQVVAFVVSLLLFF